MPSIVPDQLKSIKGKTIGGLYVYGCVDYVFSLEQERHQTGFIYRVGRIYQTTTTAIRGSNGQRGAVAPRNFIPNTQFDVDEIVQASEIRFYLLPGASGQTD